MIKQLNIINYRARFILGNNESEKHRKQTVTINISIRFPGNNPACNSDRIDDTICYDQLINALETKLKHAEINLIEHAAQVVYDAVGEYIKDSKIQKCVTVTKHDVPTENIEAASFTCSDW